MNKKTSQALDIMLNNLAFYLQPLQDQQGFQNWVKQSELTTTVSKLNINFTKVLSYNKSNYVDALVGDTTREDTNCLQYGDVTRMAELFENYPEIAESIIYTGNSSVLKQWNEAHPLQRVLQREKTVKVNSVAGIQQLLDKMEQKKQILEEKGHDNAAKAAESITSEIKSNIKDYVDNKIDVKQFVANCEGAVKTAKKSELKEHHGIFTKLFSTIINALNKLTMGLVERKETDCIQHVNKFKESLLTIKQADDLKQEPVNTKGPTP